MGLETYRHGRIVAVEATKISWRGRFDMNSYVTCAGLSIILGRFEYKFCSTEKPSDRILFIFIFSIRCLNVPSSEAKICYDLHQDSIMSITKDFCFELRSFCFQV